MIDNVGKLQKSATAHIQKKIMVYGLTSHFPAVRGQIYIIYLFSNDIKYATDAAPITNMLPPILSYISYKRGESDAAAEPE